MKTSLENLVNGSVDYAGLFPPASLPMQEVVANYSEYLQSSRGSMLGRIVIPVSRLEEFESLAATISFGGDHSTWKISALVPAVNATTDSQEFLQAVQKINQFNAKQQIRGVPRYLIDSWEFKALTLDQLETTLEMITSPDQVFLEIDPYSDLPETISRIAAAGLPNVFAKIRTGSVVAEEIPAVEQVAQFIVTCAKQAVGFKATAGLHHPIRGQYSLTYEQDAACGTLHGFLNVMIATILAFEHQLGLPMIEKVLAETSIENFRFEEERLGWQDWAVPTERVNHWRKNGFLSFGSCSFDEPSEELSELV